MNLIRAVSSSALACLIVACDAGSVISAGGSSTAVSLDTQVRNAISPWGVVPILPVGAQNVALADLGQSLFFDRILSGNRDVSCSSCHNPLTALGDAQSLAAGTYAAIDAAGVRRPGNGRQFTPRNAPSLLNTGLGLFYAFWDGRVSDGFGGTRIQTPPGVTLPQGVANLLAAQAMLPVTNRVEMRGIVGDRDVIGNPNELAQVADSDNAGIWKAVMSRVLAIPGYQQKFSAAFPAVPAAQLGFQHAANAIAAFEVQAFTKAGSPFDRYLAHDDNALSLDAKHGALLFFGKARCSQCHSGALLGGQQFSNAGVPQFGPGTGSAAPLDAGREAVAGGPPPQAQSNFQFRVAPLRNVELTAPYMHNGAYATLDAVVRHYNNVDSALKAFDPSQLDVALRASYHGDAGTIAKVLASLDGRVRQPLSLTAEEQRQLVSFLQSLTDPSARDLRSVVPAAVPSGLPVRDR